MPGKRGGNRGRRSFGSQVKRTVLPATLILATLGGGYYAFKHRNEIAEKAPYAATGALLGGVGAYAAASRNGIRGNARKWATIVGAGVGGLQPGPAMLWGPLAMAGTKRLGKWGKAIAGKVNEIQENQSQQEGRQKPQLPPRSLTPREKDAIRQKASKAREKDKGK